MLGPRKSRALLAYLAVAGPRPHPRETLATLLWGDTSTSQSRKYLRKALWQLQSALRPFSSEAEAAMLAVDQDWIRLERCPHLRLDVAQFEEAFARAGDTPGHQLDAATAQKLEEAARLYSGDLLDGWYQDWCIYERERLQNMYLMLLDKLIGYCEATARYEAGLAYGATILKYDRARESTHRQVMRLHLLAGDRTSALRQYERCVSALREELDIGPDHRTTALYERVLADKPLENDVRTEPAIQLCLPDANLSQLRRVLSHIQRQVTEAIRVIDSTMNRE